MPSSIGKLWLHVAGWGIHTSSTIPICPDLGTNTQESWTILLTELMEDTMYEMSETFPKLLVQSKATYSSV
ncbi:hypothetical protein OF83DRAFT_1175815 [Amylostereum chailletii]|nr:hypothetical protein OF83DRAFT_1175815 [Amylostereum chailletii]